jgi:hypothetical protein
MLNILLDHCIQRKYETYSHLKLPLFRTSITMRVWGIMALLMHASDRYIHNMSVTFALSQPSEPFTD